MTAVGCGNEKKWEFQPFQVEILIQFAWLVLFIGTDEILQVSIHCWRKQKMQKRKLGNSGLEVAPLAFDWMN